MVSLIQPEYSVLEQQEQRVIFAALIEQSCTLNAKSIIFIRLNDTAPPERQGTGIALGFPIFFFAILFFGRADVPPIYVLACSFFACFLQGQAGIFASLTGVEFDGQRSAGCVSGCDKPGDQNDLRFGASC